MKLLSLLYWLVVTFLSLITGIVNGQCPGSSPVAPTVQFRLTFDVAAQRFTAWYVPSDNQTHRLVTGQFTIIAPNGYTPPQNAAGRDSNFQITSINGEWTDEVVDSELFASASLTPPASLSGIAVHQVGMAPQGNDVDPDGSGPLAAGSPVTAGQPVPLFSFPGTGCSGQLRILVNDEQVQADLLNTAGININNEIAIQIPVAAGVPAQERYCSNVASEDRVLFVLPDIQDRSVTVDCPATTYSNNYFNQVLSNWNPASLPVGTFEATSKVWGSFTVMPVSMQANVSINSTTGEYTVSFPTAGGVTVPTSVTICNTLTDGCNLASDNACVVVSAPSCPMPVVLVAFDAKAVGRTARLSWETIGEDNNKYFQIERSASVTGFEAVGRVEGHGTTKQANLYEFIDKTLLNGISYYRLKQVDTDGRFTYSQIRSVIIRENGELVLLGNPVQEQLRVKGFDGETAIQISDMQGRIIHQKNHNAPVLTIATSAWSNGSYTIRAIDKYGPRSIIFILQK